MVIDNGRHIFFYTEIRQVKHVYGEGNNISRLHVCGADLSYTEGIISFGLLVKSDNIFVASVVSSINTHTRERLHTPPSWTSVA